MKKYPFEKTSSYSRIKSYENNYQTFSTRLNISGDKGKPYNFREDEKYKIDAFLSTFDGNVLWYEKEISKQKWVIGFYMLLTILLIAFIPVTIVYITDLASESKSIGGLETISSIIAAVLTSIMGLHKVATQWIGKKSFLSVYSKASSDLKTLFYSFENEWDNKKKINQEENSNEKSLDTAFINAIEKTTSEGRAIASQERKEYFEALENPSVELDTIFSNSFTSASGILKNLMSKRFQRKLTKFEEELNKAQEKEALAKSIQALKKQILEMKAEVKEIEDLKKMTKDAKEKTDMQARITIYNKEIDNLQRSLIKKESEK